MKFNPTERQRTLILAHIAFCFFGGWIVLAILAQNAANEYARVHFMAPRLETTKPALLILPERTVMPNDTRTGAQSTRNDAPSPPEIQKRSSRISHAPIKHHESPQQLPIHGGNIVPYGMWTSDLNAGRGMQ